MEREKEAEEAKRKQNAELSKKEEALKLKL